MIEFENTDSVRTMLKLERNNQSSFNAMVSVCTIARFMERQGGIPGPTVLVRYDSDDKEVDEIHLL
jgi:hypothetical protein